MNSGKLTYVFWLMISLCIHFLAINCQWVVFLNHRKVNKPVEIVYLKEPLPVKKPIVPKVRQPARKPEAVNAVTLEARSVLEQKKVLPEYNKFIKQRQIPKPQLDKPQQISGKKKVTLPPAAFGQAKIESPSYQSYYSGVREKIRRAAYDNYTQSEQGDIFVSFIVDKSGQLKGVRILEHKSSESSYLKEIASKSVLTAAPFSSFPKDLDYEELTFNVMISFEIE